MKAMKAYTIQFAGLTNTIHYLEFEIDALFFRHFESSPIKQADIFVHLTFDKRPGMFVLDFNIDGQVIGECDRCLNKIYIPLRAQHKMLVKFNDELAGMPQADPDIMYLSTKEHSINIQQLIYEYIVLSMPIKKICENSLIGNTRCNKSMLKAMKRDIKQEAIDPRWEQLKKLK